MLLNSKILGNGDKVVIILHGLYGNSDSWLNVSKKFPSEYKIHLIDLRNHGDSFHSPEFSYEVMIEDMLEYVNYYNIEKFFLVGHSMGGKLAMFFADKFPDKIIKLVIADISPLPNITILEENKNILFHLNLISLLSNLKPEKFTNYKEIENYFSELDKKTLSVILKNIKKKDGKFTFRLNVSAIKSNFNEIFKGLDIDNYIEKKINVETLFLRAANSDYIKANDIKAIKFIFSKVNIITIPETDHWLHVEKPREVANNIIEFFNKNGYEIS